MLPKLAAVFLLALPSCATPQRLSARVYEHQRLAAESSARGDSAEAAAQLQLAQQTTERLAKRETHPTAPIDALRGGR